MLRSPAKNPLYRAAVAGLALMFLAGCTHVAGRVFWMRSNTPVPTAELSIGPPESVMTIHRYKVHPDGDFSFWINPLDTDNLWVWSGLGDPTLEARHVNPRQVNDHMRIGLSAQ